MTKRKSTKRALLMSALSLLLCMSMLIGSTYAWFTDSVTSTGNKIVAGTLDVELYMHNGTEYENISNSTAPIFGADSIAQDNNAETLWEPGKTQVAYLQIENHGSLDLKYTVGLNVQNVSKDLYKVMKYAITAPAQVGVDAEVAAWDDANGTSVVVGTQSVTSDVTLEAGKSHYFALSIHMDETASNEYQGGEVNFDLTVLATQLASEEDSFGKEYDEKATYLNQDAEGNWLIATAGDLAYFAESVNAGNKYDNQTVKLIKDIDLANYNWTPIGTDDTNYFSGTFDGQGHTISNLYTTAAFRDHVGLFGAVKFGAAIENVNINNANVTGRAKVGALVGLAYSGVTINNCHVTGNVSVVGNYKVGGIVGGDYYTMTNCSVGKAASTFALTPAPTAHIKGVLFEGANNLEGDNVGGVAGYVAEHCKMENNSAIATVEGTRKVGGVYGYVGYGSTVKGSKFSGTVSTNASAEYIADNVGKISVGGVIGEISSSNKGSEALLTLDSLSVGEVTLNGVEADYTGAIVGKDRGGFQTAEIAKLNADAAAEINIAPYVYSTEELQAALDSATDGDEIYLLPGVSYGKIYLGRSTKSNNTTMTCDAHSFTTTDAEEFKAHLGDGKWHGTPKYTTTLKNLTVIGAEGATVEGLLASSGHAYGNVYDYVRDIQYTAGSAYYNTLGLENITFSNVNFVGQVNINTSDATSVYDGVTFDGCTFTTGGTAAANSAAIRYYNEANNGNVKNIVVKNCTFNNCYQGVYVQNVNGVTVTECKFDTTGHNAIAIQSGLEAVNLKNVVITKNIFNNIKDRVVRFGMIGADSNITIQENVATNSGDEDGEVMKAVSMEAGIATSISNNTWNGIVVDAALQDK